MKKYYAKVISDDFSWRNEGDLDVYLASDVDARIAELEAEITRLQIALNFWLPGVPADDPEIADRAGDDAMLLAGLDTPAVPDAEDLGWIKLREPRSL